MSLADKIKALPEWSRYPSLPAEIRYDLTAALARLELAREWIEARPHDGWCERYPSSTDEYLKCGCGRDALLKALEVPK